MWSLAVMTLLAVVGVSCGGRKHDAAYYELMVDSIRKAEQVRDIQKRSGINNDPVDAFFDSLHIHSLPISSAGSNLARLGSFTNVPMTLNEHFGYPVNAKLKAMQLPSRHRRQVVLLAEMLDSITPSLYVYTMDRRHQPVDLLCIYEEKAEDHADDFGKTYTEYFITSDYVITLLSYYQSHDEERKPELMHTRRYVINSEGRFEETIVEL